MADPQYDWGGTDNEAIAAERTRMWAAFTTATKYAIGVVIGLLVVIYLMWG